MTASSSNTPRTLWVDYAKAIGIILVVYGHVARGVFNANIPMNTQQFQLLDSAIYAFHMPLFFFLSGLFFYNTLQKRTIACFLANKFDTLFYVYVVWSLLQNLVRYAFGAWTNSSTKLLELLNFFYIPTAQFWFLYALMYILIFSIFIYRKASPQHFFAIFCIGAFVHCLNIPTFGSMQLRYFQEYFVYLALGVYFKHIQTFMLNHKYQLIAPASALFIALHWAFQHQAQFDFSAFGTQAFLLFVATGSIFYVVVISMILADYPSKIMATIGIYSLIIYLAHIIIGSGVRIILNKFWGIDNGYLHILLGVLAGVFGSILFARLANTLGQSWLFTIPAKLSLQNKCCRRAPTQPL